MRGPVAAERVVGRVRELGYDVEEGQESGGAGAQGSTEEPALSPPPPRSPAPLLPYLWARADTRAALIAALLVLPGLLFDELLPGLGVASPLFAVTSVLAMVVAGLPIARSAVAALRAVSYTHLDVYKRQG